MTAFVVRMLAFGLLWWVLSEGSLSDPLLPLLFTLAATVTSLLLLPAGGLRWRPLGVLRFVPYFLKQSVLGGIDVTRRAMSPALPLKPGFVEVPLRLKHDEARVLFVWVISLLPGTASAQLKKDALTVHVLDKEKWTASSLLVLEARVAACFVDA